MHHKKFQVGKAAVLVAGTTTALLAAAGVVGPTALAAAGTTTATGVFNAADDTLKPVNDTSPRGTVTFSQPTGGGPITGVVRLTGLGLNKPYVVVPYTDGACTPDPGGTAFPSSRFTTDGTGAASVNVTVTPSSLNPLGQLDLRNVRSISTREVLVGSVQSGPVTGPNVPYAITEGCDTNPTVR